MKILFLITARGGSKSIPDKNIKNLGGVPLIAYKIKLALSVAESKDVWVSTDSVLYGEIAKKYGATVPFIRPAELATDEAKSVDVVLHAMGIADQSNYKYDSICLLEPPVPFITSSQLREAIAILQDNPRASGIVAVRPASPHYTFVQEESRYVKQIAEKIESRKGRIRRQDFKRQITPSGGFYIAKWNSFLKEKTFYSKKTLAYLASEINSIEIDEPLDWLFAEFLIKQNVLDLSKLF